MCFEETPPSLSSFPLPCHPPPFGFQPLCPYPPNHLLSDDLLFAATISFGSLFSGTINLQSLVVLLSQSALGPLSCRRCHLQRFVWHLLHPFCLFSESTHKAPLLASYTLPSPPDSSLPPLVPSLPHLCQISPPDPPRPPPAPPVSDISSLHLTPPPTPPPPFPFTAATTALPPSHLIPILTP